MLTKERLIEWRQALGRRIQKVATHGDPLGDWRAAVAAIQTVLEMLGVQDASPEGGWLLPQVMEKIDRMRAALENEAAEPASVSVTAEGAVRTRGWCGSDRDAIHWAIARLRERLKPEKKDVEAELKKYMEEIAAKQLTVKIPLTDAEREGASDKARAYERGWVDRRMGWSNPAPAHCSHGVSLNVKCSKCVEHSARMFAQINGSIRRKRMEHASMKDCPDRTPATPRAIYEGKYYVDVKRREYCDNCGKTFEQLMGAQADDPKYVEANHACEYKGERLDTPGWAEEAKKWEEWHMAQGTKTLTEKIDEEVLSEFSQADTECLCGGPPGHVPNGALCRRPL
jgi:hypothetical protein